VSSLGNKAFSLIELMLVVGIIGLLSLIVSTSFKTFSVKSKRSEVHLLTKHIATLQESYFTENDQYIVLAHVGHAYDNGNGNPDSRCNLLPAQNPLSFKIKNCRNIRYTYAGRAGLDIIFAYSGGTIPASIPLVIAFNPGENLVYPGCDFRDIHVFGFGSGGWIVPSLPFDSIALCN